ncbi:MAG TPA: molybdopterin-synthase adenylyltransferase MoeB [Thermoplasmata archaeon]|nr:molybdopterin-synthase adenylyltransferase MoeB [Thermoplasmata archaeon]
MDGPESAPLPALTPEEFRRYSRHLLLPEVGVEGQLRLRDGSVLLVGAGGLGAPAALYLAAAGVGTIGLVDFDRVDLSNLQRQVLFATADLGAPKADRAADRLRALNPEVRVNVHAEPLSSHNALALLAPYSVVVDGSDNVPTRYLVNDACVLLGKPDVFGSVYRFEGQATVFDAARGPCYRCLFPEPPPPDAVPSCAEGGVLGVLPGLIGLVLATETVKRLLGVGEPLVGRLLLYDALAMRFRELAFDRNPACPVSGDRPTIRELIDYPAWCGVPAPGTDDDPTGVPSIAPDELAARLSETPPPVLLDVREPAEWALGHLPGAILVSRDAVASRVPGLGRAPSVVVYCATGRRSARVAQELRDLGVGHVLHLAGGVEAWAARHPLTRDR